MESAYANCQSRASQARNSRCTPRSKRSCNYGLGNEMSAPAVPTANERFLRKARKKLACCLRCFQNWGEQIHVETIVHIFDSCIQDWFSVASIVEHVLVTIKQEHPNVKMAYLKPDNVGCYHNASLILSMKSIGERAGISVRRYDFSDPQNERSHTEMGKRKARCCHSR